MPHTLIVVESPHKAHTIQSYLTSDYKIVASRGHIADLAKGRKFGLGVNVERNFEPRYVMIEDQIPTVKMLVEEASKASQVLLCSDEDREGEAIAFSIYERIKDLGKPMKRITTNEITKKGIQDAINHPRDIDMKLVAAQEGRRILDRIVGFLASTFLMRHFGTNLSAGRVQSVVAKMIVDREKEIEAFRPEEYWVIQANLANKDNASFIAKYDGKITNEADAKQIKDAIIPAKLVVQEVNASIEKKKAPPPLITAKLQQIMSKGYNISAERTMKAAQSLYEHSHITYMRTDSVRANPDAIKSARDWLKSNGHPIPKSANQFKNKDAAQDAHECIRPTDVAINDDASFSEDEGQVYKVIRQHFLASQMTPAIYNTLKVAISAQGTPHILKAGGKAIKDLGYLAMFKTDLGKIDIPNLVKNEEVFLFGKEPIIAEQKFTQPPPRYSEASIIETLEKKNIGRPSTFAELLSKITTRNYVERNGNVFHPTELGNKIIGELTQHFSFMDYNFSALMEEKLDLIADGALDKISMLSDFYSLFKIELNKAYVANGAEICQKCNSPMVEREGKNGKFLGCSGYTTNGCRNTKNIAA